jgi:hypothetical protein
MLVASGKSRPNLIHTKHLLRLQWSSKELSRANECLCVTNWCVSFCLSCSTHFWTSNSHLLQQARELYELGRYQLLKAALDTLRCIIHGKRIGLTVDKDLIPNSVESSRSCEPASLSAIQAFLDVLWNSKVHYRVQKSPRQVPLLGQINVLPIAQSYLSKTYKKVKSKVKLSP